MKKAVKIFVIACIFAVAVPLFAAASVCLSTRAQITDTPDREADCILVLGCGILPDGSPSAMLRDRLLCAIELYKSGVAPVLLMSGDNGRADYDEVSAMKRFAIQHGVDEAAIVCDHAGFSTYESIYRAKEIFCIQDVVIVTQEYHLYRALYLANSFGLNAVGAPADRAVYAGQVFREIRELAARGKDFFMAIIRPLPTFLGDKIPVGAA